MEILRKFAERVIECFGEDYLLPKAIEELYALGIGNVKFADQLYASGMEELPKRLADMFTRGDIGLHMLYMCCHFFNFFFLSF
jgi:hypothetical protein